MMEIWKDIIGYEGLYQISNLANIRSCLRTVRRNAYGNKILKSKPVRACKNSRGYLQVQLCNCGTIKNHYLHRLVATAFVENIGGKPEINHIDGNKLNNKPINLEWVTSAENQAHSYSTGLQEGKKGVDNHFAKLDDSKVLHIRYLVNKEKRIHGEVAAMYGISNENVSVIINRKSWRHI